MKENEFGRSMIEMMAVLSLIGIITIGSIMAYKGGQSQNDANKIQELVSTASLNGLTKMRNLYNEKENCPKGDCAEGYKKSGSSCIRCRNSVWEIIGKNKSDYPCVTSMDVTPNGNVTIQFSGCDKVVTILKNQWGAWTPARKYGWREAGGGCIYIPPKDDE